MSFLNGCFLLCMNHHGSPTASKDLNSYFIFYSIVLSLDITVLINFTFHCFLFGNFSKFGWVFVFVLAGVPYYAPIFAIVSAFTGDANLLRITGNMNSMSICFNYFLSFLAMLFLHDDAEYLLMIVFMVLVKSVLSFLSAKIRMYLQNPRYGQNESALRKI